MAVYAIIPGENSSAILSRIRERFADDHYEIAFSNVALVSSKLTTQGVAEKLEIDEGECGTYMIIGVDKYWGFASKDLWEWIDLKSS